MKVTIEYRDAYRGRLVTDDVKHVQNRDDYIILYRNDGKTTYIDRNEVIAYEEDKQVTNEVTQLQEKLETLREAVSELYYSGVWSCDRKVDEAALWERVRDAAGFKPNNAPAPRFLKGEWKLAETQAKPDGSYLFTYTKTPILNGGPAIVKGGPLFKVGQRVRIKTDAKGLGKGWLGKKGIVTRNTDGIPYPYLVVTDEDGAVSLYEQEIEAFDPNSFKVGDRIKVVKSEGTAAQIGWEGTITEDEVLGWFRAQMDEDKKSVTHYLLKITEVERI